MASNSILKLQVDDKQYEASLKSAQQGLQALMNALRNSGKSFSDLDKNTEQYVRALGNMGATAKTTRGRIGEMSSAFVELSQVEKQLTDQERQSPVGKALTESLNQLKQRTIEAKQELADLDKQLTSQKAPATTGGIFSGMGDKMGGALQVFGGNMLTKGVSMLTSELAGSVQQSIELARQGEGIRIAFERLGRGDLLDSLRQATHGTITDLELMKAAVRFDDFKLPLDQLGTMLAFAQQKAKDTGQSFDYMVDSIVTGLGRQSPKILDNLGLSITEIHQKTKETGDMTKAVGEIIREQMAKAGDYVETAADRAARATVDTKNKMEELGRSAMPVAEEFTSAWTEIRNGAMTLVLPVLSTVADSIRDIREILAGEWDMPKLKPGIPNLAEGPVNNNQPKRPTWGDVPVVKAPGGYVEVTDQSGKVLHGGHYDSDAQLQNMMKRWNTLTTPTRTGGTRSTSSPSRQQTEMQQNQTRINDLTQQYVTLMAAASEAGKPLTDEQQKQTAEIQRQISELEKRNGQLKLYQEQAKGKLLGPDAFKQQLSVDVDVNNKKIEELEQQLLSLNGITIDTKTVTITATDEALPKLREIQGITIDDKTMTVTAETADALRALQGIEGVTIDPKTVTITATDEALPKLREIQGITIDEKTMTVTADTQEALQALQAVNGITIDEKTVAITADDKTQPEFREVEGIRLKGKKVTVTANTMEALRAVQSLNGVTIDPKTVTITATDEALPKLREIEGITIDEKTMTVTADTQEALQALQGIDGVNIDTKTVKVTAETDEARQKVEELKRQIAELKDQNLMINAGMASLDLQNARDLSRTGGVTGFIGTGKSMTTIEGLQPMGDVVRQRGGNLLDDKAMKAVNEDISRNLPNAKEKDGPLESGKKLLNGISQLTDGLEKIGIDIPDEVQSVISVIQGVMQVIEAVNTIIGGVQATALAANTAAMVSLESALWANTFLGFSNGGIVPKFADGGLVGRAALGMTIPGNSMSGDNLRMPVVGGGMIGVNSGEVILNRAQQGNLASQLEGGAFENLKLDAVISGEQIRLVLNNNGRRTGRGEYVQSTRRR